MLVVSLRGGLLELAPGDGRPHRLVQQQVDQRQARTVLEDQEERAGQSAVQSHGAGRDQLLGGPEQLAGLLQPDELDVVDRKADLAPSHFESASDAASAPRSKIIRSNRRWSSVEIGPIGCSSFPVLGSGGRRWPCPSPDLASPLDPLGYRLMPAGRRAADHVDDRVQVEDQRNAAVAQDARAERPGIER